MSVVKIEFKGEDETKFRELKSAIGLSADTEVIRYAINKTYLTMVKLSGVQA